MSSTRPIQKLYLGEDLLGGTHPILKEVVAVGGRPIRLKWQDSLRVRPWSPGNLHPRRGSLSGGQRTIWLVGPMGAGHRWLSRCQQLRSASGDEEGIELASVVGLSAAH